MFIIVGTYIIFSTLHWLPVSARLAGKAGRGGGRESKRVYIYNCAPLHLQFHSAVVSGMAYNIIIDIVVIEIDLNGITSEGHKHSH